MGYLYLKLCCIAICFMLVLANKINNNNINLCGYVYFVGESNETTYNAALNKPAFLSSVYYNATAGLANDGDISTMFWRKSPQCAHSENETNPWWAVDLLVQTKVYSVVLTNREDHNGII